MQENLKLYIAVLDKVESFMVPTIVSHAVLGCHIKYNNDELYNSWLSNSFKKVVLKVNQKEFDKIKLLDRIHEAHENKTLQGVTSCIVILPRVEYPNVIRFAKMYTI